MSEPSKNNLKSQIEIFLNAYNKLNSTEYIWDDNKSYVALDSNNPNADAIIFSKKDNSKKDIQHKRIVWDQDFSEPRSRAANKVIKYAVEYLQKQGLNEVAIHLNFHSHIPSTKDEIAEFSFWLSMLINDKLHPIFSQNPPLYSYDINDDIFLAYLKKSVSYIHIFKKSNYIKPIFGYGWSNLQPRPLPSYGDVVVSEANRLLKWHRDTIVILEADTTIDNYDLNLIKRGLKFSDIEVEVWVIENFIKHQKATLVYSPKRKSESAKIRGQRTRSK